MAIVRPYRRVSGGSTGPGNVRRMFRPDELSPRTRRLAADAIHRSYDWLCRVAAVAPDTARGRRFGSFGLGSCISFPTGSIFGEASIHIGSGTMIGADVTLSAGFAPGQDLGPDPIVRIGDRVVLGRGSHVVGHRSIEIGDDVYTGPYVYVTDQNHVYADPDVPIGRQWPTEAPVRIGNGSWLGTGVVILPGSCIGEHVVVAAGSVVRGTFPDHCVIAGSPARVVRSWTAEGGWDPPFPERPQVDVELSQADLDDLAVLLGRDDRPPH